MIITFLMDAFAGLFYLIVSLFPAPSATDYTNVANLTSAASNLRSFFVNQNFWFPVDDLFSVIKMIFLVEFAVLTVKLVRWIASNITLGILK